MRLDIYGELAYVTALILIPIPFESRKWSPYGGIPE